ncbi:MAG: NVEALA domain-containing protein [Bacteroidales bacterium]|nr:NVEALA domain-containing protein [Bacteroidales bacterium]
MKKTFASFAIMSIVAVIAFNLNLNTKNDINNVLTLANTEALASGEGDDEYLYLPQWIRTYHSDDPGWNCHHWGSEKCLNR